MAEQFLYTFLIITLFGIITAVFSYWGANEHNIEDVKKHGATGVACAYYGAIASLGAAIAWVWA